MTTKTVTFLRDESYPFHVQDETEGWAGAGFDNSFTNVKARRVNGIVQVEIEITEIKGNRSYAKHGRLTLTPELQAELLKVLQ